MTDHVTRDTIAAFLTDVLDDVLAKRCHGSQSSALHCPLAQIGEPCPLFRMANAAVPPRSST